MEVIPAAKNRGVKKREKFKSSLNCCLYFIFFFFSVVEILAIHIEKIAHLRGSDKLRI